MNFHPPSGGRGQSGENLLIIMAYLKNMDIFANHFFQNNV